jgi:hypothetical protein
MKIIISENQELDVKKKFIFMLLNNKNYNLVEIDNDRIYFVKNIGDEKAEIRFDKSDGWCAISYDLISFLSLITGFERSEVQELIGNWVEHALQMEVRYIKARLFALEMRLNIPYKWR